MAQGVHNLIYDGEDAENVHFRCQKPGCTPTPLGTAIWFNKPWVGSPPAIWLGPEATPDAAKALLWGPSPDFQSYLDVCEGSDL